MHPVRRWVLEVLRVPDAKITTIYHGVALPPASYQTQDGMADGRQFKVGCLARFEPRKGISTLIKAMVSVCAKYPDARLLIAGSDPCGYGIEMRRLADQLQVGHAVDIQRFCDTPFDFLRQLDVFAFASVSEGCGVVLLEAMAMGIPIVASDIYPLNHIVARNETGMLAIPGDSESFASALIDLIEKPDLALCMGEAGRNRCLQEFSQEKMLKSTESLYFKLASRSN